MIVEFITQKAQVKYYYEMESKNIIHNNLDYFVQFSIHGMICEGITAGKVGNYLLIVCWNYG